MLTTEARPRTWSQMVGQSRPLAALRAVLAEENLPSTFLFHGAYGSGKTTAARILAAQVNCKHRVPRTTLEPCGQCSTCEALAAGTSDALVEIDSAVYGGVENVRTLTELVEYSTPHPYRVVVLDEAHSLSRQAFNALLKVMEEAPDTAIFVLVTTELMKIPLTVRSRAVSFYFGPVPLADVTRHLAVLAEQKNYRVTPEGLEVVARQSGSLRDAIKNLEVVHMSFNGMVSRETATDFLGDGEAVKNVLRAVVTGQDWDDLLDVMLETATPTLVLETCTDVLTYALYRSRKIDTSAYKAALDILWGLTPVTVFDYRGKTTLRLVFRRLEGLFATLRSA